MKQIKPRTPKQRAVISYGQTIRAASNSYCLASELRKRGFSQQAYQVEEALRRLKQLAYDEYINERLRIDPEWDPKEGELGYRYPSY
jgi:hypothetical protein